MCIIKFIDRLVDVIDFHPWIANLCGIFISAGVAIWVMNKNHRLEKDKREYQEIREEVLRMNKITIYLSQILTISGSLNNSFIKSKVQFVKKEDTFVLTKFIDEIQYFCNKILDEDVVINDDNYSKAINVCTDSLNQLRIIKSNIIDHPKDVHKIEDVLKPIKHVAVETKKVLAQIEYYNLDDSYKIL